MTLMAEILRKWTVFFPRLVEDIVIGSCCIFLFNLLNICWRSSKASLIIRVTIMIHFTMVSLSIIFFFKCCSTRNSSANSSSVHIPGSISISSYSSVYDLTRYSNSSFVNTFWCSAICSSTSSSIMSTNPSPRTYLAVWMIFFTSPSIPPKPLKSLTASLHKLFQHALTVSGFSSSIHVLMKLLHKQYVRISSSRWLELLGRHHWLLESCRRPGECMRP